jgi:uncharacterized membrane protein YesL
MNQSHQESDEQSHPEGLHLFFSLIRWHWLRLIGINLMFLVSCLPIVTIPCALTALSRVLGLLIQRRICYPVHDYWKAFRSEWKRSSLVGLLFFTVIITCILGIKFYLASENIPSVLCAGILMVAIIVIVAGSMYSFPMIAFSTLRVKEILKNSLLLSAIVLPKTIISLSLILTFCLVVSLYLPVMVLCFTFFGFSLIGLIDVFSSWKALQRYVFNNADEEQVDKIG